MEQAAQEREFLRMLKLLSDNDCLQHVALIGSWAEYLYQNTGLIPMGTTVLRTLDIDFLVKNMRRPTPPINLETLAREQGYAVDNHPMLGTTKISTASRLEIEFLIDQRGAGRELVYRTALGVTAQAIRGLNLLLGNMITVSYLGMDITIPIPEAYVIQKIIINSDRKKEEKKEKDRQSILALFPHLDREKYDALYETATKKQRRRIDEFWEINSNKLVTEEFPQDMPEQ
jgi:hypothetical protein